MPRANAAPAAAPATPLPPLPTAPPLPAGNGQPAATTLPPLPQLPQLPQAPPQAVAPQPPTVPQAPSVLSYDPAASMGTVSPPGEDFDFTQVNLEGVNIDAVGSSRLMDPLLDYEGVTKVAMHTKDGNQSMKVTITTLFPAEFRGITLNDYVGLNEASRWKLGNFARACGLLSPDGKRINARSIRDFDGYIVRYRIRHDEFQTQTGGTSKNNKVDGGYEEAWESPEAQAAASPQG